MEDPRDLIDRRVSFAENLTVMYDHLALTRRNLKIAEQALEISMDSFKEFVDPLLPGPGELPDPRLPEGAFENIGRQAYVLALRERSSTIAEEENRLTYNALQSFITGQRPKQPIKLTAQAGTPIEFNRFSLRHNEWVHEDSLAEAVGIIDWPDRDGMLRLSAPPSRSRISPTPYYMTQVIRLEHPHTRQIDFSEA